MNYFNYFTEIEEHFQKARGTSLFLLSPLDWALIESWKVSGVPLEAVLRGIDAAFEKWRSRRVRTQNVNSLAFCSQAVMSEAQRSAPAAASADAPPFEAAEVEHYLRENARALRAHRKFDFLADALDALADERIADLEFLETRLSVLEQKLIGSLRAEEPETDAIDARRELEFQVRPYRSRMTAEQLALLERQFLERKLLEKNGLPRLSLFYLQ